MESRSTEPLQSGGKAVTYGTLSPAAVRRNEAVAAAKANDEVKRRKALRALRGAMGFCFAFMLCEIVGGYIAHSLAILTDAAHLLTDVAGFGLSIFSLQVSARAASGKFSFGWHRAEVVGTLASMFTIWALVSVILYEAVFRIYDVWRCSSRDAPSKGVHWDGFASHMWDAPPPVFLDDGTKCQAVQAPLMVVIGALGLAVNLMCAVILTLGGHHGHSHSHGGSHGHSHGHSHSHETAEQNCHDHDHGHSHADAETEHDHSHSHSQSDSPLCPSKDDPQAVASKKKPPQKKLGSALNSAFLHALGDCVQSAGVIVAAIFIWYGNYTLYGTPNHATSLYNLADPASSVFFGIVTLYFTRPLLQELFGILMESTPDHIEPEKVAAQLWAIPGVIDVHDLHIWSLSAGKPSLSVHLVACNHIQTLERAQNVCESFGISHHTIQVDDVQIGSDRCASDIGCVSFPGTPATPPLLGATPPFAAV